MSLLNQLFTKPSIPDHADFTGQTILITGCNTGLGKEAVKHFVRRNAARVIATVRSLDRGRAALAEIQNETNCPPGAVQFWELDYGRFDSVLAFGERCQRELSSSSSSSSSSRLDKVVLNAGVATERFDLLEGHETCITVNVISTVLLACLLLPVLQRQQQQQQQQQQSVPSGDDPVLTVVSSAAHAHARFKERSISSSSNKPIFAVLDDPTLSDMSDRYPVSKLLQLFAMRELAERAAARTARTAGTRTRSVTINTVSPGLCHTDLARHVQGRTRLVLEITKALLAWTAEEGARTLVHAVVAGKESHGAFISGCSVQNNSLSNFVTSPEGVQTQKRVWAELEGILEGIKPGVTAVLK